MSVYLPVVETRAPGLVVARYEWPHLLLPRWQGELVACAQAASETGPIGVVFVLAERICEVSPIVRGFWRRVVSDPASRIAAVAIVSGSWAVEVEAMAFASTIERLGASVRVATFLEEPEGIEWAARIAQSRQALRPSA